MRSDPKMISNNDFIEFACYKYHLKYMPDLTMGITKLKLTQIETKHGNDISLTLENFLSRLRILYLFE